MRIFLYLSIGLASTLVFIVTFFPASAAWSLTGTGIREALPELEVTRVSGTLWEGEARLEWFDFPPARLDWDLDAGPLLAGVVSLRLTLQGRGLDASANALIRQGSGEIRNLQGLIDSRYINPVSAEAGLDLDGRLVIDNLSVSADSRWITSLDGSGHWTGGRVLVQGMPSFVLPPLDLELDFNGKSPVATLIAPGGEVLIATLRQGGWAEIAIRKRLFETAGIPGFETLDTLSSDETILLLEEKIL